MTDQESTRFSLSDVDLIARKWRKEWSKRSRSEVVTSQGVGFFLWRSNSDGARRSGMFYTKDMVGLPCSCGKPKR